MQTSLVGHRGSVLCLDSPGEGRLASGSEDGSVRLWDLSAGRAVRALVLEGSSQVNAVCLGRNGDVANWAFAATGSTVHGFDLRSPSVLLRQAAFSLSANRDEVCQLALNQNGKILAIADDAGDVQLFDLAEARQLRPLQSAHESICNCVAFNPVRDWELCTGGMDAVCATWDFRSALCSSKWLLAPPPELICSQILNPRHVHCLNYSPDGNLLALALGDGTVELRDTQSGQVVVAEQAHRAAASQAIFMPTLGERDALRSQCGVQTIPTLITAGDDAQLRLWSVEGLPSARTSFDSSSAKRQRSSWETRRVASSEAMDDAGIPEHFDAPVLRPTATLDLPDKPNWIVAASVPDSSSIGRSDVVCIATNAEDILVQRVQGLSF